ncbi:MAG TPA: hypothetical protein VHA12_02420 [Candidatus Nanoarchaeia archaeon]|nr:hypothetical protein [Candidatus Nanoarchaeia archaeon]
MNKWTELLLGLFLVILPIILATLKWTSWWTSALVVLKGLLFWGIVGVGVLFILVAIADIKDNRK